MEQKRPLGVAWISYFYLFGLALVFLTLFSPSANISGYGFPTVIGLPFLSPLAAKAVLLLVTVVVVYGFFTQKKWGLAAMAGYSIYFLVVSAYMAGQHGWQPFAGNAIWSLVVLGYSAWKKGVFKS